MPVEDTGPEEMEEPAKPGENLQKALLSLGCLLLSLASYLGIGWLTFPLNDILYYTLTIAYYLFITMAGILAFVTLGKSFTALATGGSKSIKNYIAVAVTIIVLLAFASELLGRLNAI